MSPESPKTMDQEDKVKDLLIRQYEYFQYLFEQEQKRAVSIVGGAKVYIGFLVFILGSIFLKVLTPEKILTLIVNSSAGWLPKLIGISLIILTAWTLIAAIVFTILVMKVWSYDRLCNPVERFTETLVMTSELEVLSKSISDFAVAINRNNYINNKRAEYLASGLKYLLMGSLLSIIAAFTLNFIV